MAKTITVTADRLTSAVGASGYPLTLSVHCYLTSLSTFLRFLSVGNNADSNSYFYIGIDITGNTTHVAAVTSNATITPQARCAVSPDLNAWGNALGVFASTADVRAYYKGANKATGGGVTPPNPLNETALTGRHIDGAFHIIGQVAQAAVWARGLTDVEATFIGIGGNPRAVKGTVSYWKITSGENPVADQIGSNVLTVTGTTAGTSTPDFMTYQTGGAIAAQNYTAGLSITPVDLTPGGAVFDDVASAYTAALYQMGTAVLNTTTASGLTAVREVVLASAAGFTAGDYVKITSGGTPARVLGVNVTANSILVDRDQTYANAAQVFRIPVGVLSVAGLSMVSNSYQGSPVAAATYTLCFFRAVCNNNALLMGDSNSFTMTITGGGGGGGGLQLYAGVFAGGFIGG